MLPPAHLATSALAAQLNRSQPNTQQQAGWLPHRLGHMHSVLRACDGERQVAGGSCWYAPVCPASSQLETRALVGCKNTQPYHQYKGALQSTYSQQRDMYSSTLPTPASAGAVLGCTASAGDIPSIMLCLIVIEH